MSIGHDKIIIIFKKNQPGTKSSCDMQHTVYFCKKISFQRVLYFVLQNILYLHNNGYNSSLRFELIRYHNK